MRRALVCVLVSLSGATACDKILGIEDARPGWTSGTGTTTTSGAGGQGGSCTPSLTIACYSGPAGTENKGICKAGTKTCNTDGSGFGECAGEVTPQAETCGAPADEDCSGHDCAQWAGLLDVSGDVATSGLAVDLHGNIVLAGQLIEGSISWPNGSITHAGTVDAFVLKLNADGTPQWGKAFGGGAENLTIGGGVAVDAAGDILVCGKTMTAIDIGSASVGPGHFVAKLSKDDGHTVWARGFAVNQVDPSQFELDDRLVLTTTPDGDVVFGGTFTSDIDFGNGPLAGPTGFEYYGFLARLRGSDGSGLWSRALCGGTSRCGVAGVSVDSQGNILLAAGFEGTFKLGPTSPGLASVGTGDSVLAKLTPSGDPFWQLRLGTAGGYVSIVNLAMDANDGPVIAGSFEGPVDFGQGSVPSPSSPTAFVAHYASDKSHVWSRILDAPFLGVSSFAAGAFVAGTFSVPFSFGAGTSSISPSGSGDVFVAKFSESGDGVWSRGFGDPGGQWLEALALTQQKEPIVVGQASSAIDFGTGLMTPANGHALFVAKLAP